MAVFSYIKEGRTLFKIRVQTRSSRYPDLRLSEQLSGIVSEGDAFRAESRIKKDLRRKLIEEESRRVVVGQTWGAVLDSWHKAQLTIRVPFGSISESTQEDYYQSTKKWMAQFERTPCADITSLSLMQLFNEMASSGLSLQQRRKVRFTLKAVFEHGIREGLINLTRNPVFDLTLRKSEDKKPEILTLGEIRKLVELAIAHKHEWRQIWALALLTGMRSGELYALQWTDIDWEQKLITVARAFKPRIKLIESTKAGYWRDVPISQDCLRLLHELKTSGSGSQFVLPRANRWEFGIQALVLRTFCLEHGLPSIRFHTLRACFATQLLRQGVDSGTVMKVGGWKDLKTMQRYIRLAGIEVTGATDKLVVLPPQDLAAKVVTLHPRED